MWDTIARDGVPLAGNATTYDTPINAGRWFLVGLANMTNGR